MDRDSAVPIRVFWILGAGLLVFSFSPILVRVAGDAPGATVAMWRTVFAGALLLPFARKRELQEWSQVSVRHAVLTIVAGLLLGLHFIVWIESIYHTSVASATILFSTNPLFIALFGFLILKERLSTTTVIAILTAVFGAILIGAGDAGDEHFPRAMMGNGLALSSAVLFSGYLLIGRVARQVSSWLAYVLPLYLIVAAVALVYTAIRDVPVTGFGWEVYAACVLMAIGPQILGHGSLNYAVRFIPAAVLGLLGLVEPVLATVWAWALFDEIPAFATLVGVAVVLVGLSLLYLPKRNFLAGREENERRPAKK